MTKLSILVYTDDSSYLALGSLVPALRSTFTSKTFAIARVNANEIRNGALRKDSARVFVLPGIIGDDSNMYQRELQAAEMGEIHNFLDRGRTSVLGICAGAYYLSRYTQYHGPGGRKTLLSSAPLFNGVALGPLDRYQDSIDPATEKRHVHLSPVTFKNEKDRWQKTSVCYGNGPVFIPDKLVSNSNIEVMAYYGENGKNNDPALIRLPRGESATYLSGIHPEIAYQDMSGSNNARIDNAVKLMEDLKPHEQGRKRLWNTLCKRIEMDVHP